MKKRIRITAFAICALLMLLTTTTAFAATIRSTATIDYGSSSKILGSKQALNANALNGTVYSSSASTGTTDQKLKGDMVTQGVIWMHTRDTKSVAPRTSASLYWANPNNETGSFWAEARAVWGNHEGYCRVTQAGH